MSKYLAIFEDSNFADFYPLTLSRPVWGLRFGIGTLAERIIRNFSAYKPLLFCRREVAFASAEFGPTNPEWPKDCEELLLINGSLLWPEKVKKAVASSPSCLKNDDSIISARLSTGWEKIKLSPFDPESVNKAIKGTKEEQADKLTAGYLWDLIASNPQAIFEDFQQLTAGRDHKKMFKEVQIDNQAVIHRFELVSLSPGCELDCFTVLDARRGPIYLDENVKVQAFSRIEGPAYIGPNSQVLRANIRGGCSIGPGCRIGGEIEETIIQGWTNKYHSGFIGHSYLGEWINFGAMTTNSDLKNDYGLVKIIKGGKEFSTNQAKVGSFIADHVKTGIGTLLNTGIQIGFSANLYGGALFEKKLIPSFAWGTPQRMVPYRVDKAVEVARKVKSRRQQELSGEEEKLFRSIYEKTEKERGEFLGQF